MCSYTRPSWKRHLSAVRLQVEDHSFWLRGENQPHQHLDETVGSCARFHVYWQNGKVPSLTNVLHRTAETEPPRTCWHSTRPPRSAWRGRKEAQEGTSQATNSQTDSARLRSFYAGQELPGKKLIHERGCFGPHGTHTAPGDFGNTTAVSAPLFNRG